MLLQFVPEWRLLGSGIVVQEQQENVRHCPFKSNDSPAIWRSTRSATDMEINLREMLKLKDELYNISHHSGQTLTKCTKTVSVITG
jgi:hypothetical protein